MIREISENTWRQLLTSKCESIFFNPDFLNVVSKSFDYKLHYLVYTEGGNVVLAAAVFSKKDKIVIPLAFTYTPIYYSESISERKYLIVFNHLVKYLKANWSDVSLRLPITLTDLRPFIWAGFRTRLRYTYIKAPDGDIHKSVSKNYIRGLNEGLTFKVENPSKTTIEKNLLFFKNYGLSASSHVSYLNFFTHAAQRDYLISFNAYKSEQLISSNLVLIDRATKTLYTLLLYSSNDKYSHTFIYKNGIDWAIKERFASIDYCGANEENIAIFKSYFNPELRQYVVVTYSRKRDFMRRFKNRLISMVQAMF